jgi:hypothetical protein
MTAEELKALLSTPGALFLVMLLGSLASMLKQVSDAKKNGSVASLGSYLAHWPETVGTITTNVLGFLTLVVTDQLNFASALGIGYAANSAADLLRSGGRSASLVKGQQSGFARPLLLALLFAIATVGLLSACQTPPNKVVRVACDPSAYTAERCAKGIAETWEVYQRRAEEIVTDPATPDDVKQPVKRAEAYTRPAIVELLKSAAAYKRIKDELAAGATDEEKLRIADAKLEEWVRVALPRIDAMGNALGL